MRVNAQNQITNQPTSSFALYRCRIQGFGNGISLDGWQCGPSAINRVLYRRLHIRWRHTHGQHRNLLIGQYYCSALQAGR